MNELQKAIYDKVVAPSLRSRKHGVKATVLGFDHTQNRAVVEWNDAGNRVVKYAVPVTMTGGVVAAGPFPGDTVWVEFINGNQLTPRVVSKVDYYYQDRTREENQKHTRKGAYVPDSFSFL